MMRDKNWVAVLVGLISPILGILIAYIPIKMYLLFLNIIVSSHPSDIWKLFMLSWFPSFLHGLLVGGSPFLAFNLITPRAKFGYVAVGVLTIWGAPLAFGVYLMLGNFVWSEVIRSTAFVVAFCGTVAVSWIHTSRDLT